MDTKPRTGEPSSSGSTSSAETVDTSTTAGDDSRSAVRRRATSRPLTGRSGGRAGPRPVAARRTCSTASSGVDATASTSQALALEQGPGRVAERALSSTITTLRAMSRTWQAPTRPRIAGSRQSYRPGLLRRRRTEVRTAAKPAAAFVASAKVARSSFSGMRGGLTVAEAAEALGTSPQTVRALLRKGQLRGEQRPWGSRYVWEVSPEGLEEFLSAVRAPRRAPPLARAATRRRGASRGGGSCPGGRRRAAPPGGLTRAQPATTDDDRARTRRRPRPFVLRPRGRATVVVVVLGVPLLLALRSRADRSRTRCGSTSWARRTSSGGPSRRRSSSASWSAGRSPAFSGSTSSSPAGAPGWSGDAAASWRSVAAALVVGEPLRLLRRGALADLSPLAAPADLRRRRPGPRQGRRVLRLHASVRGPGVGRCCCGWSAWRRRASRCVHAARGTLGRATPARDVLGAAAPRRARGRPSCWRSPGGCGSSSTCSSCSSPASTAAAPSPARGTSTSTSGPRAWRSSPSLAVALALRLRRRAVRRSVDGARRGGAGRSSCVVGVLVAMRAVDRGDWPCVPALVQRFVVDPNPLAEREAVPRAVDRRPPGRLWGSTGSRSSRTPRPAGSRRRTSRPSTAGSATSRRGTPGCWATGCGSW